MGSPPVGVVLWREGGAAAATPGAVLGCDGDAEPPVGDSAWPSFFSSDVSDLEMGMNLSRTSWTAAAVAAAAVAAAANVGDVVVVGGVAAASAPGPEERPRR